jgi:hypothetical protein
VFLCYMVGSTLPQQGSLVLTRCECWVTPVAVNLLSTLPINPSRCAFEARNHQGATMCTGIALMQSRVPFLEVPIIPATQWGELHCAGGPLRQGLDSAFSVAHHLHTGRA